MSVAVNCRLEGIMPTFRKTIERDKAFFTSKLFTQKYGAKTWLQRSVNRGINQRELHPKLEYEYNKQFSRLKIL